MYNYKKYEIKIEEQYLIVLMQTKQYEALGKEVLPKYTVEALRLYGWFCIEYV